MKWNIVFNTELCSFSRLDAKRIFYEDILKISQKEDFNLKWRVTQFSAASCILWADFMQNVLFSKISFQFGKKKFWTQNEVEHSFQQRVVFFEEISCKTQLSERYPHNLGKGSFWHKLTWNRVFKSELYSLSRFDPKRIFKQDILIIWLK